MHDFTIVSCTHPRRPKSRYWLHQHQSSKPTSYGNTSTAKAQVHITKQNQDMHGLDSSLLGFSNPTGSVVLRLLCPSSPPSNRDPQFLGQAIKEKPANVHTLSSQRTNDSNLSIDRSPQRKTKENKQTPSSTQLSGVTSFFFPRGVELA